MIRRFIPTLCLFVPLYLCGCDDGGHDHDDHDHGGHAMGGEHAGHMGGGHAMGGEHAGHMGGSHMGGGHDMGGEHAGHMGGSHATGGHDMGGDHGGHMVTACEDSATEYVMFMAGISGATANGGYTVTITGAQPMMPMHGNNTWQLSITDADGVAVEGAAVVVTPDMPDHGHGTTPATFTSTAGDEPGAYSVGPIILQMPGVWRFNIEVTPAEGDADSAVLVFCAMAAPDPAG